MRRFFWANCRFPVPRLKEFKINWYLHFKNFPMSKLLGTIEVSCIYLYAVWRKCVLGTLFMTKKIISTLWTKNSSNQTFYFTCAYKDNIIVLYNLDWKTWCIENITLYYSATYQESDDTKLWKGMDMVFSCLDTINIACKNNNHTIVDSASSSLL
jgi:hypothetical protein